MKLKAKKNKGFVAKKKMQKKQPLMVYKIDLMKIFYFNLQFQKDGLTWVDIQQI